VARPWTIVDQEIVETLTPHDGSVSLELSAKLLIAVPNLPQEERVHQFRGCNNLFQRLVIAGR